MEMPGAAQVQGGQDPVVVNPGCAWGLLGEQDPAESSVQSPELLGLPDTALAVPLSWTSTLGFISSNLTFAVFAHTELLVNGECFGGLAASWVMARQVCALLSRKQLFVSLEKLL